MQTTYPVHFVFKYIIISLLLPTARQRETPVDNGLFYGQKIRPHCLKSQDKIQKILIRYRFREIVSLNAVSSALLGYLTLLLPSKPPTAPFSLLYAVCSLLITFTRDTSIADSSMFAGMRSTPSL